MTIPIDLLRDLVHEGTWMIQHEEDGSCPDPVEDPSSRDPDCRACQVLIQADALIAKADRAARKKGKTR